MTAEVLIRWYEPGVYAGRTKNTMPMTLAEARAKMPSFQAAADKRGLRFVKIVDAAGNEVPSNG